MSNTMTDLPTIRVVHTLGPTGTNCEAAAGLWLESKGHKEAQIKLHSTLEEALVEVLQDPEGAVLLGCVVYPQLHEIVFQNLDNLTMVDQFIMPTFNMLLASRGQEEVRTAASHPAPKSLLNGRGLDVTEATSNSKAAELCRSGAVDACITTLPAATAHDLTVLEDFGPVPMGWRDPRSQGSCMKNVSWIDGALVAGDQDEMSLWNHSLHYGYGVFEGIRSYEVGGQSLLFKLQEHIDRLWTSCAEIGLEPNVQPSEVLDAAYAVLEANDFVDAYVRPIVYLGDGLGALRDSRTVHTAVLAWRWDSKDENGRPFKLGISSYRRADPASFPSFAKATGNYLLSKTATLWAGRNGFDDAILLDHEGFVSEASAQNLFLVSGTRLITPPDSRCLKGITRSTVIELALAQGLAVEERAVEPAELLTADEVFLTSTASEVLPVESVDGQKARYADERPVTRQLAAAYRNLVTTPTTARTT